MGVPAAISKLAEAAFVLSVPEDAGDFGGCLDAVALDDRVAVRYAPGRLQIMRDEPLMMMMMKMITLTQ
jgi:hypothetical protein